MLSQSPVSVPFQVSLPWCGRKPEPLQACAKLCIPCPALLRCLCLLTFWLSFKNNCKKSKAFAMTRPGGGAIEGDSFGQQEIEINPSIWITTSTAGAVQQQSKWKRERGSCGGSSKVPVIIINNNNNDDKNMKQQHHLLILWPLWLAVTEQLLFRLLPCPAPPPGASLSFVWLAIWQAAG